ncbi:MAG TPA: sulfite exporter TauE/SafE family protein [Alphaproteobacteria bacterium]|nr:sulfite exporter TauE/SafE family protein [Alphaproteobacteria bacterium]
MVIEDPVLLWTIVGGASGIILGVAGTGGGVISIPILMAFGGFDIKEASAYGLLALTVGAALSWFIQRKNTLYPIAAVLIFFAGTVAFFAAPLKVLSPQWLVNLLLNLTCIFAIYSLWVLRKPEDPGENRPLPYQLKTATFGGMITGFLSTMTGLGGGVVIIPWLTGITRLRFEQAIACSLLTIAITAPISAWRQGKVDLTIEAWIALGVSIVIMTLIVQKVITYISPPRLILVRKLTLTAVIFISMMRTLSTLF